MEFELSRNKEQEKILGILYQALVLIDLKQELDVKQLLMDAYDCDFEDVPLFSQQILVYSLKIFNIIKLILYNYIKQLASYEVLE